MISRFFNLFKLFWEYLIKGTISFNSEQATLHLDEEGNLFILPNNLVLQSKGYNFIDCDPTFTALAISYSKRGELNKLESLIENEFESTVNTLETERDKINVSS